MFFFHIKQGSHSAATYTGIVGLNGLLTHLFRVRTAFRLLRIPDPTVLALTPLRSRAVVPFLDLVFCLPTFRAAPCLIHSFLFHSTFLPHLGALWGHSLKISHGNNCYRARARSGLADNTCFVLKLPYDVYQNFQSQGLYVGLL